MPQLVTYRQNEFPAILKWQAIAFMRVQWPTIFRGELRYLADPYPPDMDPIHFVVTEGDTLISYASSFRRTVVHAGQAFALRGFGNMFTFPPYRGEGHGWRVLRSATHFIQDSGDDVAMLFCDPSLTSFYGASGWVVTPSPTRLGTLVEYEDYPVPRMMLFVSEKGRQAQATFELQPIYLDWPW